ncbi:MAG: hypothetical protein NDI81_02115 [Desulfobacula sp.]|nr:hypothetical protein [Desulfobacula sp.]
MSKRTKAARGFFYFLCLWMLAGSVYASKDAGVFTTVTTGRRMMAGHNIQQAKQGAISDALAAAVQNAIPELLTNQVLASNLDFLYSDILSRPSDFIITYRVLGDVQSKNASLVAVESRVNLELLQKTLTQAKILDAVKDKPVLMFFISEKTLSEDQPRYWWGSDPDSYASLVEAVMIEQMTRDGFVIAGTAPDRPDPAFYDIIFHSMEDIDAARRFGREMKADMIIFGHAAASLAINRMGEEKTFDAQILMEAYDVLTGEKKIVSTVQAVAKSDSEAEGHKQALASAANLSAKDLTEKINAYWAQTLRKEASFDLSLSGDNFLPRFIALKQRLREMPEFTSMLQKEVGSNSALVQIVYKGSPSRFADAVMLKTFDAFGLEITDVANERVTLRFIEKEAAAGPEARQNPAPIPEEKKEAP